jgi:O-antigen/teichoic acid export membrane protein
MSSVRRIAKNTTLLILSSAVNLVLGFFYAAYSARYLGVQGYGTIAYALALTSILGVLADLGLGQLAIREISRDRSLIDKYVFNAIAIKLILVPITLVLIAIAANLLGKGDSTAISIVYILALSTCISTFASIFSAAFQAFEKMEYSSLGNVINGAMMLSGALVAIHLGLSAVGFAYVYLFTSLIALTYVLAVYGIKFFRSRAALDIGSWGFMLSESMPFGLASLFVSLFSWVSSVMLSYMIGNEAVGWYNAAYRLTIILAIVPNMVSMSLFPVMCRFYMTSRSMFEFTQQRSFRYMTFLGLPIGVGTTLIADKIIYTIFGPAYANSVIALQILVWASVLVFTSSSFSRLLSTSNMQMTVTKVMAICAVESILLNLLLIPRFSYVGACIVAVVAEVTSLVLTVTAASKIGYFPSRSDLMFIAKLLVANVIMGIYVFYLHDLNLFLLIASSAILYFVVSYLIKVFDKYDIELFKNIFRKWA